MARTSACGDSLFFVGVSDPGSGTPDVASEVEGVRCAWPGGTIDALLEASATAAAVSAGISRHPMLHVAAHGTGPGESARGAGFRLREDVFTWADLAGSSAARGSLAVFLTCDAASGNGDAPNEALHLAAAAQQAGYLDVVATLAPLREDSSPFAVQTIYRSVAHDPATINQRVATVINDVANQLRLDPDYGSDPLMWVPYAHFGWGLGRSPWASVGRGRGAGSDP